MRVRPDRIVQGIGGEQVPADISFVARPLQPIERRIRVAESQVDLCEDERRIGASLPGGDELREHLLRLRPAARDRQRVSQIGNREWHAAHRVVVPFRLQRVRASPRSRSEKSALSSFQARIRCSQ
jgi:hypothetical protein